MNFARDTFATPNPSTIIEVDGQTIGGFENFEQMYFELSDCIDDKVREIIEWAEETGFSVKFR